MEKTTSDKLIFLSCCLLIHKSKYDTLSDITIDDQIPFQRTLILVEAPNLGQSSGRHLFKPIEAQMIVAFFSATALMAYGTSHSRIHVCRNPDI